MSFEHWVIVMLSVLGFVNLLYIEVLKRSLREMTESRNNYLNALTRAEHVYSKLARIADIVMGLDDAPETAKRVP